MKINDVMTELAEQLRNQHLLLDGTNGTSVSTPDHNRLSVTGDIDIRIRLAADDWTPGLVEILVAKAASGASGWRWQLMTGGQLRLTHAGVFDATSTVATGFTDGTAHWVRYTRNVTTGDVTFFTSDDGVTFTQLGGVVATAASATPDDDSDTSIGVFAGGTSEFSGKVFAAEIRDGIDGTVVASPRFSDGSEWQLGATSARDDQDNLWTLQGNAVVVEEGIAGLRVYDHLADNAQIPAAIVGFPESYDFDATFSRGVDMAQIPVHVLVGRITDRSSKDNLSAFVDGSGPSSIKQILESGTYDAFSSLRVAAVSFETVTLAGVELLAATFRVDVWGSGN